MFGVLQGNLSGGISLDPDAKAYLDLYSISNSTEKKAVNDIFLDVKGLGSTVNNLNFYSKIFALFLVSPTSISAAEANANLNPAYDLSFIDNPTHSTNGVVFNGTTQYATTGFIPNVDGFTLTSAGYTEYTTGQTTGYSGVRNSATKRFIHRIVSTTQHIAHAFASFFGTQTLANVNGVFTISRIGTNRTDYFNGSSFVSNTDGGSVPDIEFYIHARNNSGVASDYMNGTLKTAAIHEGLTANEVADLSFAINKYNTSLGR